MATTAASIFIHAAAPMLQSQTKSGQEEEEEETDLASKLKPLLLQLVSSGTPKAAKVATRCCSCCKPSMTISCMCCNSSGLFLLLP